MNLIKLITLTIALLVASNRCAFAKYIVNKISFDSNQNIQIQVDKKADFKTYTLTKPNRIVVDILNSDYQKIVEERTPPFITKIRYSRHKDLLRVVFDLKQKTFIQSANYHKSKGKKYGQITIKISPEISYVLGSIGTASTTPSYTKNKAPIIVIDAGHGGKDPGAIGSYARTKEKNITLSYARELARQLKLSKRYKVYLTRNNDIFIPLKQRVAKARKVKADLFISLHANTAENHAAKGFSIYTLSDNASDRQAALLARKENRADIISGINFENASSDILKTLIDMSQRSSMNHSSRFANISIQKVKARKVEILHNTHRFAGFVVLTAPDMVSILIELGYLSNKQEEKDLNNIVHKRKICAGLVDAIDEYFKFKTKN